MHQYRILFKRKAAHRYERGKCIEKLLNKSQPVTKALQCTEGIINTGDIIMSIKEERDYYVLYCTAPTKETALSLSDRLVSMKLAACVNIIDTISSIYRWKGEICRETEFLMIIKSRKSLIEHIEREIREHHPYEVPEIIHVPLVWGYDPYLRWIDENTV